MRFPQSIGRAFAAIVLASNWIASFWIFALMLLVVADVAMRSLLNAPIVGVNEIMEISIVAMLYLQVTQALRDGRHTRSDAFYLRLVARRPRVAQALNIVFAAAGFLLMVAIVAGAVPRLAESWRGSFTIGNQGVFIVPEWPVRLVIIFGCTTMTIQFLIVMHSALRGLRAGTSAAGDHHGGI